MITKQNIHNLRFISHDGKFTYFQTNQGELILSTNYESKSVLKKEPTTYFLLYASPERKKIIIESSPTFFTSNNLKESHNLSTIDYGTNKLATLGVGISPKLHFQDSWASFYHADTKILVLQNLNQSSFQFEIQLQNPINPFFAPEVIMIDPNTVLFTDINKEGLYAIIKYTRAKNKSEVLFKADTPGVKIELCYKDNLLLFGQFPLSNINAQSSITQLKINGPEINFKNKELLYSSTFPDIGNMTYISSENKLFFIKAGKPIGSLTQYPFDLFSLNLKNKELKAITDFGFITHAINMDEQIFVPYNGKYYIALGEDTSKNDQLKKIDVDEVIKKINDEIQK